VTISKASISLVSTGQMVHTDVSDNANTNIKKKREHIREKKDQVTSEK